MMLNGFVILFWITMQIFIVLCIVKEYKELKKRMKK